MIFCCICYYEVIAMPSPDRTSVIINQISQLEQDDKVARRIPDIAAIQRHYQEPAHKNGASGSVFDVLYHWPQGVPELPNGFRYEQLSELSVVELRLLNTAHDHSLGIDELLMLYEHQVGIPYPYHSGMSEIRYLREDQGRESDRERLASIMPELVQAQLPGAYEAYGTLLEGLSQTNSQLSAQNVAGMFEEADASWRTNGMYDVLANAVLNGSRQFNLVIAPGGATKERLIAAARHFGSDQFTPTRIDDLVPYDRQERYSEAQESNSPRLLLVPTLFNPDDFTYQPDAQMKGIPRLMTMGPTETLAYFYALREQYTRNGNIFTDEGAYQTITSFPEFERDGRTLQMYIERDGGLRFGYSGDDIDERCALVFASSE